MEFWGVEIKSGESVPVENEAGKLLHISQACLVENKKNKATEPVYLYGKVGDKKFVLGILSSDKIPRLTFDLVFKKQFELSHSWKNGSVHILGYTGYDEESDSDADTVSDDEMVPIPVDPVKYTLAAENDEEDDSTDESSEDEQANIKKEEEETSDDELGDELESDDEESDDSEEEDKKVEVKKVDTSKKRSFEAASKHSAKKARLVTPEKSGGKTSDTKVVHVATPYPTKQTARKSNQPNQQTPSVAGAFKCKSCKKSCDSYVALKSHIKAKHHSGN